VKRFNFDEFLWFIVLILLELWIIYLVFTGKMDFYIGKEMIKYSYITILMISIIAIFQFKNVFTAKGNSKIKIKLLPIILTLILGGISAYKQETFKHAELDKELKDGKTSRIEMQYLYEHESDYNSIESKNDTNSKDKNNLNQSIKKNLEDEINIAENNKKEILIVNQDNPMVLDDIRVNPKKYIGRNLEIHGFVCKGSYLNENQFIIGRIVINCCAADSKVVGIIGEYDKAYDLYENEKIIARGTIGSSIIKDDNNVSHSVPIIIIEKLNNE
jgi:putative membrane protein